VSDKDFTHDSDQNASASFHIRLPGFVNAEDIGLGSAIKRVAYALGVTPCGGCERRAAALDRHITFSGKGS
jgi:hypothetical protein